MAVAGALRIERSNMAWMRMVARVAASLRGLLVLLAALLAIAVPAHSQEPTTFAGQQQEIAAIARQIDVAERELRANEANDAKLVEIRVELDAIARALSELSQKLTPKLTEINARLEQIGPAPAEGQVTEAAAVTAERNALQVEKSEINALIGQVDTQSTRAQDLDAEVSSLRRSLFADTLSRRYDLSAVIGTEVLDQARVEVSELYGRVGGWLRFILRERLGSVLIATAAALFAALLLLIGGRRLTRRLIPADTGEKGPSYLTRLSVAFWSTLLQSGALAVFLIATYFFYDYFGLLRSDIEPILATVFNVVATVYFIDRLARAALSPDQPDWRLVDIDTRSARIFYWLIWATAVVTGLDFIANRVNEVQTSPLSLTIAKSLLATVVVGLLLILMSMVTPMRADAAAVNPWGRILRFLLRATGTITILAALFGYIGLARFISQQVVITGALLAAMYIGFLSARAMSDFGAFSKTTVGRRLDARYNFDEQTEDQLGLLVGIVVNGLILLIGIPLILLQWGFQWGDIYAMVYSLTGDLSVGSINFSLVGIVTGIIVVAVGYFITRWLQIWLDESVMARGKVDAGVRNSIRTVVGYVGIAIAILFGISAAGINLSNLALIAGALSLGIGFGLQNIVSNFVSGLILLAERPFKVGDWIVAGPVTGNVRRISVRATEIETFQKQTIILPNSELINAAVGNWTHRNKLGRVDINVGASYDADPRRVHALLLEILQSHPTILKTPEPIVSFAGFGPSSLDFDLMFHLADITTQLAVRNEVRFTIFERFKEEGIAIPFPQRDVYIRAMPEALQDSMTLKTAAPSPKPARTGARKPRGRSQKAS